MGQGWEFRFDDRVFYVGASDLEAACYMVLQHLGSQADVKAKTVPADVLKFLKVRDGILIEAKIFNYQRENDANRT
jgi:hypothetical protein